MDTAMKGWQRGCREGGGRSPQDRQQSEQNKAAIPRVTRIQHCPYRVRIPETVRATAWGRRLKATLEGVQGPLAKGCRAVGMIGTSMRWQTGFQGGWAASQEGQHGESRGQRPNGAGLRKRQKAASPLQQSWSRALL